MADGVLPTDHVSALGDWLQAARKAAGLTQEEASRRSGVKLDVVAKAEQGRDIRTSHFLALITTYDAARLIPQLLRGEPFDDRPDYVRIAEKQGMRVAEGSTTPPGLDREEKKKPRSKGA